MSSLTRLSFFLQINGFVSKQLAQWLNARIPAADFVALDQRRIFIFPNSFGFLYLVIVFILFLAGVNYQNNLILAFCFLLTSLFLNGIFNTYRNLSGLRLENIGAKAVFAGENIEFKLLLTRVDDRQSHSICLFLQKDNEQNVTVDANQRLEISLSYPSVSRGYCRAPRIYLYSVYPFGLMRTWSWIDLNLSCLVYPKAIASPPENNSENSAGENINNDKAEGEIFSGLRPYRMGDRPRQIAWKVLAKGGGLHSNLMSSMSDDSRWIDWSEWLTLNMERRLSAMCYLVCACEAQQISYGLRLPGLELPQSQGKAHFQACLQALALFALPEKNKAR